MFIGIIGSNVQVLLRLSLLSQISTKWAVVSQNSTIYTRIEIGEFSMDRPSVIPGIKNVMKYQLSILPKTELEW